MRECVFCRQFATKKFDVDIPISETPHFVLIADIAPVTFGHILILPKEHFSSLADMNRELLSELSILIQHLISLVGPAFDFIGLGEHGSGGAAALKADCVEHAHLHLCPIKKGPEFGLPLLESFATSSREISSVSDLEGCENRHYLLWGGPKDRLSVRHPTTSTCSQALRRVMNALNGSEHRRWQDSFNRELALNTARLYHHLIHRYPSQSLGIDWRSEITFAAPGGHVYETAVRQ